jgi:hypothetical protein
VALAELGIGSKTAHGEDHIKQSEPRTRVITRHTSLGIPLSEVDLIDHWRDRMNMRKVRVDHGQFVDIR